MTVEQDPTWINEFIKKLRNTYHISKVDSLCIAGEIEMYLRKILNKEICEKKAEEYALELYDNIDVEGLLPIKDVLLVANVAYKHGFNEAIETLYESNRNSTQS